MPNEPSGPRRVILRLRAADFTEHDSGLYSEITKTYFDHACLTPESTVRTCTHTEPIQENSHPRQSFHVVIDLEKDVSIEVDQVPHELLKVRRNEEGQLSVGVKSVTLQLIDI